jgi:DNA-binding NtrC family response regulator
VGLEHLPGELRAWGAAGERRAFQPLPLAELERHHIERALRHFRGNRTRTARALGISRATLINKIRSYGLN